MKPAALASPSETRAGPAAAASFIDPQALMHIRNLELRARMVVEGFWHGLHRSPFHGFSVEFTEYRPYSPGDDPRWLDWRVFARTDRFFIKKYEDETNLRCYLLADKSPSMRYGSRGYTKADYAATLAATLGYFLYLQGDATGLLTFDEQVRDFLPARHRPGHLRQLMLALEKPPRGGGTDLRAPLRRMAEIIRKRSLMVLISDFLSPIADLEVELTTLAAGGHELVLFQVLDPAELDFPFRSPSVFEDLESGRTLYLDPEAARGQYLSRLGAHLEGVRAAGRRLGAACHQVSTSRPLELVLFEFLRERLERRRSVRRASRRDRPRGAGTT